MSDGAKPAVGSIGWVDLTIANAEQVCEFYQAVVGWESDGVEMGGYEDFTMSPPGSDKPVAGICHSRGANSGLPPVWLIYLTVADLEKSLAACRAQGGKVLRDITGMGSYGRYAVIQDPAGAAAALFQPTQPI
jgi:predicted enzyme related to lactoylglutathione lyase